MLEEDNTATRVGALSVSPEPVTPTQSSSNSPNTDVITPYSVLKFAERLPTDSSSDLNKLMKPKSLHSLDDVDVILDCIAEYMSFCTAQKDYTLPASSPLGDPKYFFDIGRIAAKEADTRWVSRLVAYPVQQQMNYLGTATTSNDELFRQIILRTQFKDILTARNKLNEVQMNWSIQDYEQRWLDFIKRFDKVLNRSTLIKSPSEPSYTMLDERTIIKALLTNIGLASLHLELWPKWKDSKDLHSFFSIILEHYYQWCKKWTNGPTHVQLEQKNVEILMHRDKDSWNDIPKAIQRSASKISAPGNLKSKSSSKNPHNALPPFKRRIAQTHLIDLLKMITAVASATPRTTR
ncbi:hypothetical protein GEMRC1_010852 [Eukaryota sp. GEM-RC1]